jgi:hypothetical protein
MVNPTWEQGRVQGLYERHWFAVSIGVVVALTGICAWSDARVGADWGTILFGVVAGVLLLAVVFKTIMTSVGKY